MANVGPVGPKGTQPTTTKPQIPKKLINLSSRSDRVAKTGFSTLEETVKRAEVSLKSHKAAKGPIGKIDQMTNRIERRVIKNK